MIFKKKKLFLLSVHPNDKKNIRNISKTFFKWKINILFVHLQVWAKLVCSF